MTLDDHRSDEGTVDLDSFDKAIVAELQVDGRLSYSALSDRVGLSAAAVRQRVRRLLSSGAIQVVAVADPALLGFSVQAMIGLTVNGDVRDVARRLADLDSLEYVVATAGRYDVICEVVCHDMGALFVLVNSEVRQVDGVDEIEILTYLHLEKQSYAWGVH